MLGRDVSVYIHVRTSGIGDKEPWMGEEHMSILTRAISGLAYLLAGERNASEDGDASTRALHHGPIRVTVRER